MKTALAVALAAAAGFSTQAAAQANEQFVPVNSYWVGPYAPGGSGIAAGMIDYFKLLNARDRGINGVKLTWEKCETEYRNDRSEEHTSELQSPCNLVCRLLLEKKKKEMTS